MTDAKARDALADYEPQFFDNVVLVLDRLYVHRIRAMAGKDGNPLNEVDMLCESIVNNDGVHQASTVLKLVPENPSPRSSSATRSA